MNMNLNSEAIPLIEQVELNEADRKPIEGYDKLTLKACFTLIGSWCILLIIGA
jgi:hypothetical protein